MTCLHKCNKRVCVKTYECTQALIRSVNFLLMSSKSKLTCLCVEACMLPLCQYIHIVIVATCTLQKSEEQEALGMTTGVCITP